eukprot:TRINITY_DN2490_c0_g1_i1.p1 TRINITY_DN2490_c0_g1~~TRINITY_DN2490_c0_g1_i1.p1  ORF type:complete len:378 (-),score=117.40 TRINITY_DN2490_c0_g1_i1:25-1158(-)
MSSIHDKDEEIDCLKDLVGELKGEIHQIHMDYNYKVIVLQDYENENKVMRRTIEGLRRELKEANRKIEELSSVGIVKEKEEKEEHGSDGSDADTNEVIPDKPTVSQDVNSDIIDERLIEANNTIARLKQHLLDSQEAHDNIVIRLEERIEELVQYQKDEKKNDKRFAELEKEIQEKDEEIQNVNAVIEGLQFQQEQEIEIRTFHLRKKIEEMESQIKIKDSKIMEYESTIKDLNTLLESKEGDIKNLEDVQTKYQYMEREYESMKAVHDKTREKLQEALDESQEVIDKNIIKQMIVRYFSTDKKQQVLKLLAQVLDLDTEEKIVVGLISKPSQSRWNFFRRKGNQEISETSVNESDEEKKRISDMWIEFLVSECDSE